MKTSQFVLESDATNEVLNAVSAAIPINSEKFGTVIPLHIYDVTTPVGYVEGVISKTAADHATGSSKWSPVDGGNLEQWPDGICTGLYCPFTHIRVKPTSGQVSARLMQ